MCYVHTCIQFHKQHDNNLIGILDSLSMDKEFTPSTYFDVKPYRPVLSTYADTHHISQCFTIRADLKRNTSTLIFDDKENKYAMLHKDFPLKTPQTHGHLAILASS
jgi:hypothetical protein